MRSMAAMELDAGTEKEKAKDFIRSYDASIVTKFITLYVFLLFSVIMLLTVIPLRYTVNTVQYYVFREFNSITPNDELFDSKTMSMRAERMMDED